MAPDGVKVYNPAFDVTDHTLIDAIITEYGVARAPYEQTPGSPEKEWRRRRKCSLVSRKKHGKSRKMEV